MIFSVISENPSHCFVQNENLCFQAFAHQLFTHSQNYNALEIQTPRLLASMTFMLIATLCCHQVVKMYKLLLRSNVKGLLSPYVMQM